MIGILVVTHGGLASELVRAAGEIAGETEALAAVGLDWSEPGEDARGRIEQAIGGVDRGAGVLILTDMFGGTPSNLAIPFLKEGRVEIVTGANLPMLLRSLATRREEPLAALAHAVRERGRKSIEVASDLLSEATRATPGLSS
ncbi:MAG TPA: PTS fructose transporter subunit IIA [Thermoanaerobaculia bacterium]|jgi:PTS system mannose-specific IIA component|nr:PTS fructose transporter subunit IIA [Thermoanaerobaculia bacterium]